MTKLCASTLLIQYVLDLKGYSLFKLSDLTSALSAFRESITAQPEYAWAYFDLARAYCAKKEYPLAAQNVAEALRRRPSLKQAMNGDREFLRLCGPISDSFSEAARSHERSGGAMNQKNVPNKTAPTDVKVDTTADDEERGCNFGVEVTRDNGKIPAELKRRIRGTFVKMVCDLAGSMFNNPEDSIALKLTFGVREDGSVGNDSIQRSSGRPQFDDAVTKAFEAATFSPFVDEYKSGTPIRVLLDISYRPPTR